MVVIDQKRSTILLGFPEVICWKILSPQSPWLGRIMVRCSQHPCFYIGCLVNCRPVVTMYLFFKQSLFVFHDLTLHLDWVLADVLNHFSGTRAFNSFQCPVKFHDLGCGFTGLRYVSLLAGASIYLTSSSFRSESYLATTRC